jgi:hypothetical protein
MGQHEQYANHRAYAVRHDYPGGRGTAAPLRAARNVPAFQNNPETGKHVADKDGLLTLVGG